MAVVARVGIAVCGILAGASACAGLPQPNSLGLGPVVLCGKTFYDSSNGVAGWSSALHPGGPGAIGPDPNGVAIIEVADGCDEGNHVTWSPSSAARLVNATYGKNGLPTVVGLQPASPDATFTVTVTHDGKVIGTIKYANPFPPPK